MNQQMSLLEARAVARDRERQLQPVPRRHPRHGLARPVSPRRLLPGSLRRHAVAREAGSRPSGVAAVRG